jgi:hypothetical protein
MGGGQALSPAPRLPTAASSRSPGRTVPPVIPIYPPARVKARLSQEPAESAGSCARVQPWLTMTGRRRSVGRLGSMPAQRSRQDPRAPVPPQARGISLDSGATGAPSHRRSCRLSLRVWRAAAAATRLLPGGRNLRQGAAFQSQGSGGNPPGLLSSKGHLSGLCQLPTLSSWARASNPLGRRGAAFRGLLRLPRSGPPTWRAWTPGLPNQPCPPSARARRSPRREPNAVPGRALSTRR